MWVGGYHKFRTLLISVLVISAIASFASGVEAVLLLAAPVLGIFPVPGNVARRMKD